MKTVEQMEQNCNPRRISELQSSRTSFEACSTLVAVVLVARAGGVVELVKVAYGSEHFGALRGQE